jgi:ABC-type proline/glycine betaine transport system permease subunit
LSKCCGVGSSSKKWEEDSLKVPAEIEEMVEMVESVRSIVLLASTVVRSVSGGIGEGVLEGSRRFSKCPLGRGGCGSGVVVVVLGMVLDRRG